MEKLVKQVGQARRRLILEQFVTRLTWCLFAAFAVAAIAIAVPKLIVIDAIPTTWGAIWLTAAGVIGAIAALLWTWLVRRNDMDAAIEIDLRYNLKERIASSLSLPPDQWESDAGRALVKDAVRRIERIEVSEKFQLGVDGRSWLPLIPAMLAFVLILFVDDRTAQSKTTSDPALQAAVKTTSKNLRKEIKKRAEEAEKRGMEDATELFKKLERSAENLEKKKDVDRKKALIQLNDLAKELEQRQKEIGGGDKLKQQFDRLKQLGKGPAEKLGEALKKGDLNKALQEMKKLQEQIAKGDMNAENKQKLAEQLNQMKQQLNQIAQQHKQATDQLQKQIDQQQKQGNTISAAQLQRQLDQMKQGQPQMNMLQKMAQQLGDCQQCMKQGDSKGAAQAMQQMTQQLGQMQQQMDEMKMLQQMLQQIADAKQAMNCGNCKGAGCAQCQGQGQGQGQGMSNKLGLGGNGMGAAQGGFGPRPDEENKVNFRDSQVRANPGQGRSVIKGEIDGPNIKGAVLESIKQEQAAVASQQSDPLLGQRLDRTRREHAEEYFNSLREN